jgi:hypothetical protein
VRSAGPFKRCIDSRVRRAPLAIRIVAILGVALLEFVIPWWVPALRKVASDSYMFGFSNAAAVLGVGLCIAAFSLLALFGGAALLYPAKLITGSAGLLRRREGDAHRAVVLAVVLVGGALPFLFWLKTASSYFGESGQFLNAIDQILMGKHPYSDFIFAYGPFFLYGPIALSALAGGAIRLDTSYMIFVSAETAAGLAFLWMIVRRLDLPKNFALGLYLLVAIAGLNLTLGENYTPFRFLFPFAAMIFVHGRARDAAALSEKLGACALAAAASGFGALVSPEIGLVAALGLSAIFFVHARESRPFAAGIAAALLAPLAVAALFSKAYLFGLLAFGSGGYNFPVLPTPHIVFYLITLLITVPLLVLRGFDRGEADAPLSLGLAVGATILAAAALGRCDPGHVYWNGLVLFPIAAALLLRTTPRAGQIYLAVFALLFTIGGQVSFWNHYGERISVAFSERARMDAAGFSPFRNGDALWARGRNASSPFIHAKMPTPDAELRKLEPYRRVGTPIDDNETIDRFLKLTGKYIPERMPAPIIGILTEDALAKKIEDIDRMEVLLFPSSYSSLAEPLPADEADRRSAFLGKLLLFPVHLKFRKEPFLPQRDVVAHVLTHFHAVDDVWGFQVMVRNDLAPPAAP